MVSVYTVATDEKLRAVICFADVKELSALPDYEMAEVALMDELPENLTYPLIQPCLFNQVLEWMTSRRLEFKNTPRIKCIPKIKAHGMQWRMIGLVLSCQFGAVLAQPKMIAFDTGFDRQSFGNRMRQWTFT